MALVILILSIQLRVRGEVESHLMLRKKKGIVLMCQVC